MRRKGQSENFYNLTPYKPLKICITMLSIKLFCTEDIAECADVRMLNLLQRLDDLGAALIHESQVENSLQVVHAVGLDMIGLVADGLIAECARLVVNVDLLTVQRN